MVAKLNMSPSLLDVLILSSHELEDEFLAVDPFFDGLLELHLALVLVEEGQFSEEVHNLLLMDGRISFGHADE